MRTFQKLAVAAVTLAVPAAAFALSGTGPRVTITGKIDKISISSMQKFNETGGTVVIRSSNGQLVNVEIMEETKIISEGRLSRRTLLPTDLRTSMEVRVSGWRVGSNGMNASLFIITNIETNSVLSGNGVVQSLSGGSMTITMTDGTTKTLIISNDTEVNISYTLWGPDALTLVGKQVTYTVNPNNVAQIRVLRIVGNPAAKKTDKPTTVEFGRREAN